MTKLHINLVEGTLEVDGEESFVQAIYNDFKDELTASKKTTSGPTNSAPQKAEAQEQAGGTSSRGTRKSAARRSRSNFSIVKDLDLSAKNKAKSLRDFYAEKAPVSAMECNVVFVYYLQQIASIQKITLDHIYSCYKDVGVKFPNALRQSVADTSSRRGWLDTSSFEDIKLATPGENYVEHDLPKATKA